MTQNEVRRLWKGLALWNEEVENAGEETSGSTSTSAAERKKATAADKRRFQELAQESSEKRN